MGQGILIKRNIKLFFKDKGMFFTSLITPLILLVLYATFLADVYRDKKVVVAVGDKVLYEKKKQKLAPGEMETVELTDKMIAEAAELGGVLEFKLV